MTQTSDRPERSESVPADDLERTDDLQRAAAALTATEEVLVLTGAGISAASGVPTFRGEDGLWKEHRPEELATPAAFRRDPRLVWEWYAWRRELVDGCEPNTAHVALARWSLSRPGVRIVTQNVDGLHMEALRQVVESGGEGSEAHTADEGYVAPGGRSPGDDRRPVDPAEAAPLELHGSLFRVRCTACDLGKSHRGPVDASSGGTLPRCPDCGALLRPDVVWFGESLDRRVLEEAVAAAEAAAVCLVVGTSAVVQPAASLATRAVRSGAMLIEVNPEATPLTASARFVFRAGATEVVPRLVETASA